MSDTPRPRWCSLKDAAAIYSVHPDTLRRRIREGKLTGLKLGYKTLRIDLNEVEVLFQKMPTTRGSDSAGGK
jgi:hypothetical protein